MITQLDLRHFKCFDLLHLPLRPLTLLSGTNASGKSSVLQALVLLHQTMREHEWSLRLMLNGAAVQLGTVSDVVDKVHGRHSCEIGLVDEEISYTWMFTGERSEMSMTVKRVGSDGHEINDPTQLRYLLPPEATPSLAERLRNLTYLTAERVGPREMYKMEDLQVAPVVGPSGEHAVSVLHSKRDEHVCDALALPDVSSKNLLQQVEARMRTFFPGCRLEVVPVPHANAVTLGLRTSDDTNFHRPAHAGFGITQVLPIVVATLAASREDILLIENPEVHLHPAGQALMGQFLAAVAQTEVQVILETHSDHILNGIRRAVKAGQLPAKQVSIHFFQPRGAHESQVMSPVLDDAGNIDTWPEGFFDQFDKDMSHFAGWD